MGSGIGRPDRWRSDRASRSECLVVGFLRPPLSGQAMACGGYQVSKQPAMYPLPCGPYLPSTCADFGPGVDSSSCKLVERLPTLAWRSSTKPLVGGLMIGDFFLDGVKLQARMESLCSHSEAENLTQWSGHLKGRKTGFQALQAFRKLA